MEILPMNGIITIKMTADEARQCANEIKAGINDVGKRLLQLYEGEGWKVLGYDTWRECAQMEFGFKQSHVYQLLEFAEVTRNIEFSTIVEKLFYPPQKVKFAHLPNSHQKIKLLSGNVLQRRQQTEE
jgi:hypothetical protein